jgi:hypothetical protein
MQSFSCLSANLRHFVFICPALSIINITEQSTLYIKVGNKFLIKIKNK